jgi:nucleotide-binding universal stress UspA family protein
MSIRRMLCAVDYSDHSRRALRHAAAIAGCYRSDLHVLHVLPGPWVPTGVIGPRVPRSLADVGPDPEHALRMFVDAERLPLATTCVVRRGTPAYREIGACAEELPADLIVIGTHGSSGFDQVLLGSTAERLVNHARCPVVTVPRDADEPGSQDRVRFTSVLCAVDFSAGSLAR